MKFQLGQVVVTAGVMGMLNDKDLSHNDILGILNRHVSGDWGELCDEDKESNNEALEMGSRILSSYQLGGEKVWVITEWDRSATTILFPDEY